MPLIVTVLPFAMVAPADGEVIVEVGAVVSAGAGAAIRPESSVAGLRSHVGEQVDGRLLHVRVGPV